MTRYVGNGVYHDHVEHDDPAHDFGTDSLADEDALVELVERLVADSTDRDVTVTLTARQARLLLSASVLFRESTFDRDDPGHDVLVAAEDTLVAALR